MVTYLKDVKLKLKKSHKTKHTKNNNKKIMFIKQEGPVTAISFCMTEQ